MSISRSTDSPPIKCILLLSEKHDIRARFLAPSCLSRFLIMSTLGHWIGFLITPEQGFVKISFCIAAFFCFRLSSRFAGKTALDAPAVAHAFALARRLSLKKGGITV